MEPIAESGFVANADYADEERGRGATSEVSLWWLERRYPSQFALRNVIRNEGTTGQPIGDKIDEYQLRRYAAQMEDFRRENEAKATTPPVALPSPQSDTPSAISQ